MKAILTSNPRLTLKAQGRGIATAALSWLIERIFAREPEVDAVWTEPTRKTPRRAPSTPAAALPRRAAPTTSSRDPPTGSEDVPKKNPDDPARPQRTCGTLEQARVRVGECSALTP